MTKEEKLKLYWEAKEAYYNGEEIMTDLEFDELEKELGLENKSEVGARHNPSYIIKHPVMMGSLSKVQIHKDKNGNIDWETYFKDMLSYISKSKMKNPVCILTPKYDGCSFEIHVNNDIDASTRGDGEWGRDITKQISSLVDFDEVRKCAYKSEITLRGEVLVKKQTFLDKYVDKFSNPRSFVSGVLNSDYSEDAEYQEMLHDLDIVIYDFKYNGQFEFNGEFEWHDLDWTTLINSASKEITSKLPQFCKVTELNSAEDFAKYYEMFAEYRDKCEYALDGFVIKPLDGARIYNPEDKRPKDCVAIKFIPMLQETEVIDITWQLAKTGELIPIIWVNPVEMDGRMVQKCSGSNYGNLVIKKVSIGSKIVMSLAGDIIPFLYKVTNTDNFDVSKLNIPEDTWIDGIHLMKFLTEVELNQNLFINSAESLNIPNIGSETAKKIFQYMCEKLDESTALFFDEPVDPTIPDNILYLLPDEIYFGAGSGRAGEKAKKAFSEMLKRLSLQDIIVSCSFKFCGKKVAEKCADYLMYGEADFSHMAEQGYTWCMDKNSKEYVKVMDIIHSLGKEISDFIPREEEVAAKSNQIPIIMTGEPTTCSTKAEFLKLHPEYRNTTSWKEVQIVFTNSLDSNTGKMKKAREKNIEIRLY